MRSAIRKVRFIGRIRGESGYSLVEVLAAIMILSLAIIPMVGMFDAGLRAASTSGNYDKARALANTNLESIKAMSFPEVEGLSSACPKGGAGFTCTVDKTYVHLDITGATAQFEESSPSDPKDMVRVKITVKWGDNNSYSTTGLVAR